MQPRQHTDHHRRQRLRQQYWALRSLLGQLGRLAATPRRDYRRAVVRDLLRYVTREVRPVRGQTRERARAAAAWLCRAQDATPDAGVSYGYFPCDVEGGWDVSYPETTGYIIPTLLAFGHLDGDARLISRALDMARWEIAVQMRCGAAQGGKLCPPDQQTPAAFNTGMVLHGLSAAYRESGDEAFLTAGAKAAEFLLADMTADGHFRTHGAFVSAAAVKTYNSLCGWPLYLFGQDTGKQRYLDAGIRAAQAALRQQLDNGWIANNCLTRTDAPLLHTIGYTLQALVEVGVLAGREDLVDAARRGAEPIVARMASSGRLAGRYRADWTPALGSSCLTGSAQLAVVLYRLCEHTREDRFRDAADRILDYLKGLQLLDTPDPGINGALAGSFPILGDYMTGGYPNWATKYLLDALMLQEKAA